MLDIYERWFQNKDLHITEKHELDNEEYTKDISCTIYYPVRYIGVNEEREFLKFWEMYLEIVSQISESGYNLLIIASFTKLLDVRQEEFIKATTKLVWSTEYNGKPKYRLKGLIEILWIIIKTCVDETEEEGTNEYPSIDDDICENDTYQGIYDILKEEGLEITIEDILRIINILKFTPEQIYDYKFIEIYNNHQHLEDNEIREILLDWIKNQQTREIYEEAAFKSDDENFDEENVINTPPNP
ncbi:hypothetical protein RclHR1_11570007 [Rhizophagus clarus]|uniref:Uncharacterized protein n=1 Tax=Rhizophagus clarus TaxID=94130 RepID=A0A2Z6QWD4_9GLOM|nr:hypothetical protein RclHR1_11570007 [Rhizophagus clarus]